VSAGAGSAPAEKPEPSGSAIPADDQPADQASSPDGQTPDAQPTDRARSADGQTQDGQTQDEQTQDGQTQDGQTQDGQTQDGQTQDGQPADEQPTDAAPSDAQPADAQPTHAEPTHAEPTHAEPSDAQPADAQPSDAQPTVPLPSVPLPSVRPSGSDPDGWLPFAASDEPTSDRDRAAGRTAMAVAAAVVALCGVGGLVTFFGGSGDEGTPNAVAAGRTSAPAVASPEPSSSRTPAPVAPSPTGTAPRATPAPRATDTRAAVPSAARPAASRPVTPVRNRGRASLTAGEVFGSDRVTVQGREYRLVYTDSTTDCASGARGATAAELRRSGCTQLIRALAVDGSGRLAVTVGVANLPDAAGARRVVAAAQGRGGFTAMWNGRDRRDRRGGGDDYRETGATGRFVVYGIGTGDRAAMQAVADLRGVVAGRVRARG
jgi:hypothetical protein